MKIITKTRRDGELCYIQVKDILFLSRITKNSNVMQQYINLINEGHGDNDFIRITQKSYIEIIKKCDYIADFIEFGNKNTPISYISSLIVTLNFSVGDEITKECVSHKTDDLRDIMAFKKGELEYKIPLVANGSIEMCNEDKTLVLDGTAISDCFIIKSIDGVDIQNKDYYDFYLNCLDRIYSEFYPDIEQTERKYDAYDRGNVLVICIHRQEKKKENKMRNILAKFKRGSK